MCERKTNENKRNTFNLNIVGFMHQMICRVTTNDERIPKLAYQYSQRDGRE
jgi:hypothetical protein